MGDHNSSTSDNGTSSVFGTHDYAAYRPSGTVANYFTRWRLGDSTSSSNYNHGLNLDSCTDDSSWYNRTAGDLHTVMLCDASALKVWNASSCVLHAAVVTRRTSDKFSDGAGRLPEL